MNLNRGIALLLSREGYEVRQVYTIKEAKEAFQKGDYALVISDITLPDGTGLDFGRMVRAGGDTYLIYLTALDQEIDIVNGYDTGQMIILPTIFTDGFGVEGERIDETAF